MIKIDPKRIRVAKGLLKGIEYEEVALAYIELLEGTLDYIADAIGVMGNCICPERMKGRHHTKECKKVQDALERYKKIK